MLLRHQNFLFKTKYSASACEEERLLGAYVSTFFLTLANPMTILSFAAIFAGLGIGRAGVDYGSALYLVLGVFLGSSLWRILLTWIVGLFASNIKRWSLWVNRISGAFIVGFSLIILLGLTS